MTAALNNRVASCFVLTKNRLQNNRQNGVRMTDQTISRDTGKTLLAGAMRMTSPDGVDIGFTRTLTTGQSRTFSSRVLYRDPLLVVLPRSRAVKSKRVRIADLADETFVLFHREGRPSVFDATVAMCQKAGFSPRVENQPTMLQTVLSLVEAEQGVSIVPACARNLRSNGVRFYRLQPDDVRIKLVAAWKKANPSVVLRAFWS